jgi:hypothetical protein
MKIDPSTIHRFLGEAHHCAMQMMENGSYIRRELPSLRMSDALRKQLETLCAELIGTKHDLIHEIHESHELAITSPDSPTIRDAVGRMCQWINEAAMSFRCAVEAVQKASETGEADDLLPLLLMESGVNILNATPSMPDLGEVPDADDDGETAEAEDWEDGEDSIEPNCYAFHAEDSYPIGILNERIDRTPPDADTTPCDPVKTEARMLRKAFGPALPLIMRFFGFTMPKSRAEMDAFIRTLMAGSLR